MNNWETYPLALHILENGNESTWNEWSEKIGYFRNKYKTKFCIPLDIDLNHSFLWELRKSFDEDIVGQNQAKEYLAELVLSSILNIWESKWPLWVCFFHWPTGVGKTEIIKSLAHALFWDRNGIIKINCENYADRYTAGNLFWSPKWYIGYGDNLPITQKTVPLAYDIAKKTWKLHPILNKMPWFNILLFDEIEKAHNEVLQQLLALLDEWIITLSNGEVVNLQNSLIIFTSNLWQNELAELKEKNPMGFTQSLGVDESDKQKNFKKSLRNKFSPEFIGRIHNFIEFEELTEDESKEIIDIQLNNFNNFLLKYFQQSNIQIELSPDVYENIFKKWYSKEKWARELVREFNNSIKKYINRILHSDGFKKYFEMTGKIIIWIDIDEKKQFQYFILMDSKISYPEQNQLLLTSPDISEKLSLDKLRSIYANISAYVEIFSLNLEWNIEMGDELKIYSDTLKSFWLTQIDISSLQNRAYVEQIQQLEFIRDFEILWNGDPSGELFFPFDERTIIKIIERKMATLHNTSKYDQKAFLFVSTKRIFHTLKQILNIEDLSQMQVKKVSYFIRKLMVEKY